MKENLFFSFEFFLYNEMDTKEVLSRAPIHGTVTVWQLRLDEI